MGICHVLGSLAAMLLLTCFIHNKKESHMMLTLSCGPIDSACRLPVDPVPGRPMSSPGVAASPSSSSGGGGQTVLDITYDPAVVGLRFILEYLTNANPLCKVTLSKREVYEHDQCIPC